MRICKLGIFKLCKKGLLICPNFQIMVGTRKTSKVSEKEIRTILEESNRRRGSRDGVAQAGPSGDPAQAEHPVPGGSGGAQQEGQSVGRQTRRKAAAPVSRPAATETEAVPGVGRGGNQEGRKGHGQGQGGARAGRRETEPGDGGQQNSPLHSSFLVKLKQVLYMHWHTKSNHYETLNLSPYINII